jgi:hypothetical protein
VSVVCWNSKVVSSVTFAAFYLISQTQLNALLSFSLCQPLLGLLYRGQTKLLSLVSDSKDDVIQKFPFNCVHFSAYIQWILYDRYCNPASTLLGNRAGASFRQLTFVFGASFTNFL